MMMPTEGAPDMLSPCLRKRGLLVGGEGEGNPINLPRDGSSPSLLGEGDRRAATVEGPARYAPVTRRTPPPRAIARGPPPRAKLGEDLRVHRSLR